MLPDGNRESVRQQDECPDEPSVKPSAEMTSPFIDMRRFGIRHLMLMALTFALALTLSRFYPFLGRFSVLLVTLFWSGCGALAISDAMDSRPVEDRNWGAQIFNAFGAVAVGVAIALGLASMGTLSVLAVSKLFVS